jgi:hypothetical protein
LPLFADRRYSQGLVQPLSILGLSSEDSYIFRRRGVRAGGQRGGGFGSSR